MFWSAQRGRFIEDLSKYKYYSLQCLESLSSKFFFFQEKKMFLRHKAQPFCYVKAYLYVSLRPLNVSLSKNPSKLTICRTRTSTFTEEEINYIAMKNAILIYFKMCWHFLGLWTYFFFLFIIREKHTELLAFLKRLYRFSRLHSLARSINLILL